MFDHVRLWCTCWLWATITIRRLRTTHLYSRWSSLPWKFPDIVLSSRISFEIYDTRAQDLWTRWNSSNIGLINVLRRTFYFMTWFRRFGKTSFVQIMMPYFKDFENLPTNAVIWTNEVNGWITRSSMSIQYITGSRRRYHISGNCESQLRF